MAFYKNDNNMLLRGENKVISPDFILLKEDKDTYNYPVGGWYWFESIEEAKVVLNIVEEVEEDEVLQI